MLLVCALHPSGSGEANLPLLTVETAHDGPVDAQGKPQPYDRLIINLRATGSAYKVLLMPYRFGEELPQVAFDAAKGVARVRWKDQADVLTFTSGEDNRTRFHLTRDGKELLGVK